MLANHLRQTKDHLASPFEKGEMRGEFNQKAPTINITSKENSP